ncbi:Transcription factor MYB59 [Zostera marina]|uniref:Transcription factor MYB59 n=1 Tax=Zostera marina TaxID=29655 RepID=A0A0K9Q006_ZOSMR|nr:Transcription factor MYB59 [Zostera marina]
MEEKNLSSTTMRKGPWTEEEDMQLVYFVSLFGERRWDFIAKVSGLHRTGKSCRLRWVNYLHPGLKRGRMSPQEERLVLELHSRWGNRWSRIARKLPGRTDNEIKNYWRTHMRKKAQERKRNIAASTASSSSSTITTTHAVGESGGGGGNQTLVLQPRETTETGCYPMEKIWDEIDQSSEMMSRPTSVVDYHFKEENWRIDEHSCFHPPTTSSYDDVEGGLWRMNQEEEKELMNLMSSIGCGGDTLLSNPNT